MVLVTFLGRLFQVVIGPGTTEDQLALRRAPAWAGASSGEELVSAMSPAQIRAITSLARTASSELQGVTGTTTLNGQRVPRAAARMAELTSGQDFGGRSVQEQRQARAQGRVNVSEIEQAARERGVTVGQGGGA